MYMRSSLKIVPRLAPDLNHSDMFLNSNSVKKNSNPIITEKHQNTFTSHTATGG